MDRQFISEEDKLLWASRGYLKGEIECEVGLAAIQDQTLQTKCHAIKILQTRTDSKFRLYHQFDKTIDHTVSACPILLTEQHINSHVTVCVINCALP
jgi:hypothetical protein